MAGSPGDKSPTGVFLQDLRDRKYSAAYAHLCASEHATVSLATFTSDLEHVAAHRQSVKAYFVLAETEESFASGESDRSSSVGVTLADGSTLGLTFDLQVSSGTECISGGYGQLLAVRP